MHKKISLFLLMTLGLATFSFAAEAPADKTARISPMAALALAWIFDLARIDYITAGFITRDSRGIFASEKRYEKEGKELRLLGMAHIANSKFYRDIKQEIAQKPAIMLMEGVTDDKELLQTPPDYDNIAGKLGLASQRKKFSPFEMPENVEVIRADLDVADFAADTVKTLNAIGQIYSKEGINFAQLLQMYLRMSDRARVRAFFSDLISKRNLCLIDHIEENLPKTSLIIVPWGAMHLPQIEKWVRDQGFELKQIKKRSLLEFPAYLAFFLPVKKKDTEEVKFMSIEEIFGI